MNIDTIGDTILDESSSPAMLRDALDAFVLACSEVSHVAPDPCFDAWAGDSLLDSGVAINPEAAAHCALDYQRTVVFIRGIYAAINALKLRFPDTPLKVLYAGCGPFATLLLPLLGKFSAGDVQLYLLDFHQRALDSVALLLTHFDYSSHQVNVIQGDATHYRHPEKLHLIIAETMQKSLEQEPQFTVTANLASQLCSNGVFIPQRIDVALCLADLEHEKSIVEESLEVQRKDVKNGFTRQLLATVCSLLPEVALEQLQLAQANSTATIVQLAPIPVEIPRLTDIARFDAALYTRICVFDQYWLKDYESQITLPLKCHEILPLVAGERYNVSYQLGSYPKFSFERLDDS